MGDENGFQVGMGIGMGIAFEKRYGYGCGFLRPVPDLLVKSDQNTVKSKKK